MPDEWRTKWTSSNKQPLRVSQGLEHGIDAGIVVVVVGEILTSPDAPAADVAAVDAAAAAAETDGCFLHEDDDDDDDDATSGLPPPPLLESFFTNFTRD
jgi:hypothetical protein